MPERKKRKKRQKRQKKEKKLQNLASHAYVSAVDRRLSDSSPMPRTPPQECTAQHSPAQPASEKKKIVSISVCTPPKKQFFSTMPQILQQMLCRGMVFRAVPAGFSVRPASPRLFFFFFFPFSSSVTQEQCFMRFTALSAVASRHTRSCHLRVAGRPSL